MAEAAEKTGIECSKCGKTSHDYKVRFVAGKVIRTCRTCADGVKYPDVCRSTFPFVTTNFTGDPVEVQSLHHLRKLEREHGVQSVAYNSNEQNFERG